MFNEYFVSAATVYYYCYKRASLRISDPRFYEDMDWEPEKQRGGQIID